MVPNPSFPWLWGDVGWDEDGVVDFGSVVRVDHSLSVIQGLLLLCL